MKVTTQIISRLLLLILFLGNVFVLNAQTSVSGVINSHTEVNSVDFCNNLVAVGSTSGFASGDLVLIIQMQGAQLNTADGPTFGQITDYGSSGLFELLHIESINANIITFTEAMLNTYDASGAVQLVQVPEYTDVSIDGTLTADPWDGLSGGVLTFIASGTVTFNADIDLNGMGFRGGTPIDFAACENSGAGFDGYGCALAAGCGAPKGEGIGLAPTFELGRGPLGSGGGGGNDHNTGGGGGANYGSGGLGGERLNESGSDCLGDFPGLGGNSLTLSPADARLYMGGGGGAGDGEESQSTAGGNGGGLVLIRAADVVGNGFSVHNTGLEPATASGLDGAGGGGAGGTVALEVTTYSGTLNVNLTGGAGGDVDNGNDPALCYGPGGGGAGGALWVSSGAIPPNINMSNAGGTAGLTVNANAPPPCAGSSNGATGGQSGGAVTGFTIPESNVLYEQLSGSVTPQDTSLCLGDSMLLTAVGTATGGPVFNWSTGQTGAQVFVSPESSTIITLTISDNRGCAIVQQISLTVGSAVDATTDPDFITAPGQVVHLIASDGFQGYTWAPDQFLSGTTGQTVDANPFETTTYCVTATDTLGCVTEDCVTVEKDLLITIPNAFTPDADGLNDIFRIPDALPCEEILEFKIFNRWGELVYDFSFDGRGWDGTDGDGHANEIGTYIYVIRLLCSGQDKRVNGTVTLLR